MSLQGNSRHAIFREITLIFLLLVIINQIFLPKDPGYRGLQLLGINPLMLFCIFITASYGTAWGYYAAALAALYTAFSPPCTADLLMERLPLMAFYFLLLLIFGPIHDMWARRLKEAQLRIDEWKKSYQHLNEQHQVMAFLKENYERTILTRPASMAELYSDAGKMQILEPDALFREILNIISKYTEAQKCCIYILEGRYLRLKHSAGFLEYDRKPRPSVEITESPFNMVIEKGEMVSITREDYKAAVMADTPLLTGPLKNSRNEILGIITIDGISLLKFNPVMHKTFAMLCDWASRALENAMTYKDAEGRRIIDPELQIYRYHYFMLRLEEALASLNRGKGSFTFASIHILNWDKVIEKYDRATIKFTVRLLGQTIREYDILAHGARENRFLLLMPDITEEEFDTFLKKLSAQVHLFNLKAFERNYAYRLQIHFRNTAMDFKSLEDYIARVEKDSGSTTIIPLKEESL